MPLNQTGELAGGMEGETMSESRWEEVGGVTWESPTRSCHITATEQPALLGGRVAGIESGRQTRPEAWARLVVWAGGGSPARAWPG